MKPTLITLFSLFIVLSSCYETKKKDNTIETTTIKEKQNIEEVNNNKSIINNDWIHDIKLDGTTKWEANIETTEGINEMLNLVNESSLVTIDDYHSLANNINEIKNKIVKECTMKGASHDNLHIFLYPLIEKINLLLKITSTKEGSAIIVSIKENLNAYKNYFK